MRTLDVETFILILQQLPPKTLIHWAGWRDSDPIDREDFYALQLYEKDGDVRLYIDSGEECHDYDKHSSNLLESGGAWERINPKLG